MLGPLVHAAPRYSSSITYCSTVSWSPGGAASPDSSKDSDLSDSQSIDSHLTDSHLTDSHLTDSHLTDSHSSATVSDSGESLESGVSLESPPPPHIVSHDEIEEGEEALRDSDASSMHSLSKDSLLGKH